MNIVFLRTDFWFGLTAGGSVGHVSGILSAMKALGHRVRAFSTDILYGVTPETAAVEVLRPWSFLRWPKIRVLGPLLYNVQILLGARRSLSANPPDLLYQRHAIYSFAAALLARHYRCPLILEVNDLALRWARERSETIRLSAVAALIERYMFRRATLVVAVSRVLHDQLVEEGVPPEKIIVNPNGVDSRRFHPDIPANEIRNQLGLGGRVVVGFIGTFGSWHGVEELGQAIQNVARRRSDVHFLLVGDGLLRPALEQRLASAGLSGRATFTGLVPADEAPRYLAACDLFVSPHGRPRTGRFIGSPTKLFEYMAMGRGLVASALDQIADVLQDGETALLVEPGNVEALSEGILRLASDRHCAARLGRKAREKVLAEYTWEHNVSRTIAALEQRRLAAASDDPGLARTATPR
jgi:glycosyltransferase involved in cell wall biosynthesis